MKFVMLKKGVTYISTKEQLYDTFGEPTWNFHDVMAKVIAEWRQETGNREFLDLSTAQIISRVER